MKLKRNMYLLTVVLGSSIYLLAGCSFNQKTENIDTGMQAVQNLEYETALTSFEQAIAGDEDKQLAYRGQGMAYMGMTMYEEALEAFTSALNQSDGRVRNIEYDINYYMATAYYKLGNLEEAIKIYDAIIALKPKSIDVYYLRGMLLLENGNYESALEDFSAAIALDPKDYGMYIDIYKVMEENGHEQDGKVYLQEALEVGGEALSNYERGRLSFYMKDYEEARNYLEKARDVSGVDGVVLLGKTYEELGDYNYAASVYTNYLTDDPENVELRNQLGLCKLEVGAYEEALTAFQTAAKVENNNMMQTLAFNEIVTYEYLGDFKKATVLMESYLRAYPDDEAAKREYIFLKTR